MCVYAYIHRYVRTYIHTYIPYVHIQDIIIIHLQCIKIHCNTLHYNVCQQQPLRALCQRASLSTCCVPGKWTGGEWAHLELIYRSMSGVP